MSNNFLETSQNLCCIDTFCRKLYSQTFYKRKGLPRKIAPNTNNVRNPPKVISHKTQVQMMTTSYSSPRFNASTFINAKKSANCILQFMLCYTWRENADHNCLNTNQLQMLSTPNTGLLSANFGGTK